MDQEKKYILVGEDEIAYAETYKNKLEKEGFEIKTIQEGDKVFPELQKRKPDLLILDLIMPKETGFDILKKIRADSNLKDLKVVVASNLSQDGDLEKVKEYGIEDYFIKSNVSIFEMVDIIKKNL